MKTWENNNVRGPQALFYILSVMYTCINIIFFTIRLLDSLEFTCILDVRTHKASFHVYGILSPEKTFLL